MRKLRLQVDALAVESQKRAANAWKNGYFKKSVTPVKDINGLTILDRDEHPRSGVTLEALAGLQPSFALIGESGAGKSLTGMAIIGLLEPPGRIAGGEIRFGERDVQLVLLMAKPGPDEQRMLRFLGERVTGELLAAPAGWQCFARDEPHTTVLR